MAKKRRKPSGLRDTFTLWQWGLLCIFGGVSANFVVLAILDPDNTAEGRGQRFGAAAVAVLFTLAGVVMIIVGALRGKK